MYTIKEVAAMFRVSRQSINNWMRQGKIKYIKLGKAVRISEEEVERLKKGE